MTGTCHSAAATRCGRTRHVGGKGPEAMVAIEKHIKEYKQEVAGGDANR